MAHGDGRRRYAPVSMSTRKRVVVMWQASMALPRAKSRPQPNPAVAPRFGEDVRMAGPSLHLQATLRPLVEPVRAQLRRLDPQDVPETLRKVVAYTGKSLPPPLFKSLLIELDRNEWLRTKLAEQSGDLAPEIAEFLERPPGWWLPLIDDAVAAAVAAPAPDTAAELEAATSKLVVARRRIATFREELTAARREAKALRKELRTAATDDEATARIVDLEERLVALRSELDAERTTRLESEARVADLKRRRQRRSSDDIRRGKELSAGLTDPVAAARSLDIQAAALAAAVRGVDVTEDGEVVTEVVDAEPLHLPFGLAPDSADAITWLVRDAEPVPVIVDGYNVTFLLEPDDFGSAETRRRLVAELERLVRIARAEHRVVVVFDSDQDGGETSERSHGGVEISFATNAATADDDIVARARALEGRAVIITNDRELRERVGAVGGLALWGTALVAWIGRER